MAKQKVIRQQTFRGKHPLFTQRGVDTSTSGTWWEINFYYLWFEFMKRSPYYKKVCDKNGKGNQKLYRDWGDIRDKDFKTWWNEKVDNGRQTRGNFLFAEPKLPIGDFSDNEELMSLQKDIDDGNVKVIVIPTYLKKDVAVERVRRIMRDKYEYDSESRARYPINKSARNRESEMLKALEAYDLWKKGLTLTEIGAELRKWTIVKAEVGASLRKGETMYNIKEAEEMTPQYGANGEVIEDLVQYAKGLGHRMVMKGRRNVDNIHNKEFPLPIRDKKENS
jgi:hypothetical protein